MSIIHTSVGHNVERLDAADKVSGDAQRRRSLPAGVLTGLSRQRSAHAKIRGYKLDAARARCPRRCRHPDQQDLSYTHGTSVKDEVPLTQQDHLHGRRSPLSPRLM